MVEDGEAQLFHDSVGTQYPAKIIHVDQKSVRNHFSKPENKHHIVSGSVLVLIPVVTWILQGTAYKFFEPRCRVT